MPDVSSSSMVVPASLAQAGPFINSQAATIEEELNQLKNLLAPLQATWTGQAQTYYEGLQNEWNMAAEGLFGPQGILGYIAKAMGVNFYNYEDCESANTQTWRH